MHNSQMPGLAELPTHRQLFRSLVLALMLAGAILIGVVLPAEYGIDPTGVGRALGLAEMGEIKTQLAADTEAEEAETVSAPDCDCAGAASAATEPAKDSSLESQLPQEWREEGRLSLAPGEGEELKLKLEAGEFLAYEWQVDQGHLNSDLHTDQGPDGGSHSYRRGRAETSDAGQFEAITSGSHGWFWRNRSEVDVTVVLRVRKP